MSTDQTTPSTVWSIKSTHPLALPALLLIGTGGAFTNDLMREAKFYLGQDGEHLASPPMPSLNELNDDIAAIKSTLKLTIAEIAKCLGVSRQAIYDWKAGASIKEANATKFSNLMAAVATIAEGTPGLSPLALRRKLPGGKTLLESISSGANGSSAALALIEMLRTEDERRTALTARFEGRRATPTSMVEAASGPPDDE